MPLVSFLSAIIFLYDYLKIYHLHKKHPFINSYSYITYVL